VNFVELVLMNLKFRVFYRVCIDLSFETITYLYAMILRAGDMANLLFKVLSIFDAFDV